MRSIDTVNGKVEENMRQLSLTTTELRSTFNDRISDVGSELLQTKSEIRSELHASSSQIYSEIKQTASSILLHVENEISDVGSRIEISADQIRSEVHSSQSQVWSSITQSASQIALKVGKGNVATQLAVEMGNVTISNGNLVVDGYIKSDSLSTVLANIQNVKVKYLEVENSITAKGGVSATAFYLSLPNGSGPSVANAVAGFGTATSSGGKITIPTTKLDGTAGPSINFNIADTKYYKDQVSAIKTAVSSALGSAAWNTSSNVSTSIYASLDTSNKVVKVTSAVAKITYPGDSSATSVNISIGNLDVSSTLNSYATSQKNAVTLSSAGWVDGKNVVKTNAPTPKEYTVNLPAFDTSGGTSFSNHKTTVNFTTQSVQTPLKSVTVDATSEYTSGETAGKNAVTINKGSWSGGTISFTKSTGTASTKTVMLSKGSTSWSGYTASVPINDASGSSAISTGYTVTVDAEAIYNAGWNACIANATAESVLTDWYTYNNADSTNLYYNDGSAWKIATGSSRIWRYGGYIRTRYKLPDPK
jgi:hypothetical protein